MDVKEIASLYNRFKFREDHFHNLMTRRISHVLLVANLYDSFILEQDGRLSEQIHGEYRQLDLSMTPRITTAPRGQDVMNLLKEEHFDLVIIMRQISDISPYQLAGDIREAYPDLPLLLLLNRQSQLAEVTRHPEYTRLFDDVFFWNGDTMLFVAMIKSVEDRLNAPHDTKDGLVRVILLIESSIPFYSLFLPLLTKEIMRQTQHLISTELNDLNKRLRMRARPKVLLVHNYEDAINTFERYRNSLSAVFTNVNLKVSGEYDLKGGIRLIERLREESPDLPILMQSADFRNKEEADRLNTGFVSKNSPRLLHEFQRFMLDHLGFGDFIFRLPDYTEISRATTSHEFLEQLRHIPNESLLYHARHNHFSAWLLAHGNHTIAGEIRHLKVDDFPDSDSLRSFLIDIMHRVNREQYRGSIINFSPGNILESGNILRMADGSLGGKGRGIAFLNALITSIDFETRFPDVDIDIPRTAIIGTDEYDWFLEHNHLHGNLSGLTDKQINDTFLSGRLSHTLLDRLRVIVQTIDRPLAVRSSGLLEDSQSQPFAGIYETWMVPNSHPDEDVRLQQLADAVKVCLSNPFHEHARRYIHSINLKLDEEKMAVVIQEISGSSRGDGLFYPHFSGVAQSYNFYPAFLKHSDGICNLAVGLGKAVVGGEKTFRFCPKHPNIDLSSPTEIVENNQRHFYAVDTNRQDFDLSAGEDATLRQVRITNSHKENSLLSLTSVWDYENKRFIDGRYARGPRVITYRNQIYYSQFPLSEILSTILDIGEIALGVPVEIEFAVNLENGQSSKARFTLLQIRPLTINRENIRVDLESEDPEHLLLASTHAMGNGKVSDLRDVIFVDPEKFDNTKTLEIASELETFNNRMQQENRNYILFGPGRWGTSDRFLGIPVKWSQIDQASIIVEVGLKDYRIESSQGSHFFHNLVAMNIGYFSVPYSSEMDYIHWQWLKDQPAEDRTEYLRHVRFNYPFEVVMDGRKGHALIRLPDGNQIDSG